MSPNKLFEPVPGRGGVSLGDLGLVAVAIAGGVGARLTTEQLVFPERDEYEQLEAVVTGLSDVNTDLLQAKEILTESGANEVAQDIDQYVFQNSQAIALTETHYPADYNPVVGDIAPTGVAFTAFALLLYGLRKATRKFRVPASR